MTGIGKMTWPDDMIYQGEFKKDQKFGIGCITYSNGNKYIGEWRNDK